MLLALTGKPHSRGFPVSSYGKRLFKQRNSRKRRYRRREETLLQRATIIAAAISVLMISTPSTVGSPWMLKSHSPPLSSWLCHLVLPGRFFQGFVGSGSLFYRSGCFCSFGELRSGAKADPFPSRDMDRCPTTDGFDRSC